MVCLKNMTVCKCCWTCFRNWEVTPWITHLVHAFGALPGSTQQFFEVAKVPKEGGLQRLGREPAAGFLFVDESTCGRKLLSW